jgi:hypothetical protein
MWVKVMSGTANYRHTLRVHQTLQNTYLALTRLRKTKILRVNLGKVCAVPHFLFHHKSIRLQVDLVLPGQFRQRDEARVTWLGRHQRPDICCSVTFANKPLDNASGPNTNLPRYLFGHVLTIGIDGKLEIFVSVWRRTSV